MTLSRIFIGSLIPNLCRIEQMACRNKWLLFQILQSRRNSSLPQSQLRTLVLSFALSIESSQRHPAIVRCTIFIRLQAKFSSRGQLFVFYYYSVTNICSRIFRRMFKPRAPRHEGYSTTKTGHEKQWRSSIISTYVPILIFNFLRTTLGLRKLFSGTSRPSRPQ